jgi:hypothetical protein
MRLTLEILEPQFAPNGDLKAFELKVKASGDPTARRPIAEYVPAPAHQPKGCEMGLSTLPPPKGWERIKELFDEWSLRRAREP